MSVNVSISNSLLICVFFCSFLFSGCGILPSLQEELNRSEPRSQSRPNDAGQLTKDIENYALQLRGIPYKYGGKDKNGFDCSGFTSYVLNHHGVNVKGSSRDQVHYGRNIRMSSLHKGDLVFFGSNGKVNHVALVLDYNSEHIKIIHATSSNGVRVDYVKKGDYWMKKFITARRIL